MLVAPRQELIDIIEQLANNVTELIMQIDWLKRQVFGAKSERFISDDDQQIALELGITTNDENEANTSTIKYERRKKPKRLR